MKKLVHRAGLIPVMTLLIVLAAGGNGYAAPPSYGAIAYSQSLQLVGVGFASSLDGAVLAAVADCQKKGGGGDCIAYVWFQNAYGALARSRGEFGTGWGPTANSAASNAIGVCQQYGGSACKVTFATKTQGISRQSSSAQGGIVPVPAPTPPPGTPPGPVLSPEQQQQLADLASRIRNDSKALSCVLYVGKVVYTIIYAILYTGAQWFAKGAPLAIPPPPQAPPEPYLGKCDKINVQTLTLTDFANWSLGDPLMGVQTP
jgi:hypothetical protein